MLKNPDNRQLFTINNKETTPDIAEEFADHFSTLLNYPRVNAEQPPYNEYLPSAHSKDAFTISTNDINTAISMLKTNKTSDPFHLVAEHFIHSENDNLNVWICDVFNQFFESSTTPNDLSKSRIIRIVKSMKKSLKSPNNYRGISIIPVLTKILEYVIIIKCPAITESHSSQYGFKENSSTLHAEYIINETIKMYHSKNSPVYICSLDAEKAFDSCNWNILFNKLRTEKNIPENVIAVIRSLYEKGTGQVNYNKCTSTEFTISQGVRQGSILSPYLYNLYTELLLKEMETNCKFGTSIYGIFTAIVMYADDIILMSPTLSGLQKLANLCNDYSNKNGISLNPEKTELLISGNPLTTRSLFLDHFKIHPQQSLKHLGFKWTLHIRSHQATVETENIQERINNFWTIIHTLINSGIKFCHPETIVSLFKSLPIPTLTYGIELCTLSESLLKKLDIEGRSALKALFGISKYSKNYLNTLLDVDHVSTLLIRNKLNLCCRLMNNPVTRKIILSSMELNDYPSFMRDMYNITNSLKINIYDIIIHGKYPQIFSYHQVIPSEKLDMLLPCINLWKLKSMRTQFKYILEERVVRP